MFSFDSNMFWNYCLHKINPFGINIMNYVNNARSLFFRLWKIDHIAHYYPLSCQILSYINIFIINKKSTDTGFHMDVKSVVSDH